MSTIAAAEAVNSNCHFFSGCFLKKCTAARPQYADPWRLTSRFLRVGAARCPFSSSSSSIRVSPILVPALESTTSMAPKWSYALVKWLRTSGQEDTSVLMKWIRLDELVTS